MEASDFASDLSAALNAERGGMLVWQLSAEVPPPAAVAARFGNLHTFLKSRRDRFTITPGLYYHPTNEFAFAHVAVKQPPSNLLPEERKRKASPARWRSAATGDAVCAKVYVDNLSGDTERAQLREAMATFGRVTKAEVVWDSVNNRCRGYGIVTFDDPADAEDALRAGSVTVDCRAVQISKHFGHASSELGAPGRGRWGDDDESDGWGGGTTRRALLPCQQRRHRRCLGSTLRRCRRHLHRGHQHRRRRRLHRGRQRRRRHHRRRLRR
jgi:hypothetical protein